MQFGPLKLKHCKYGWMLFKGPYIGKCFDLYGEYSDAEVEIMRAWLPAGATAIDVGANIGDLTLPIARIVGESGRVYAIESHPAHFNVLCANLALNDIRNTRPINAFVATSADADTASAQWGEHAYIGETWPPSFVALDDLQLQRCDLIKIDVDGHELDVLRSGEMQIERFRPVLYFENDVQSASRDLLAFAMDKLGYRLYWHPAPIFRPQNFFGNPNNAWAPQTVVSMMVLGLPKESPVRVDSLEPIEEPGAWWQS